MVFNGIKIEKWVVQAFICGPVTLVEIALVQKNLNFDKWHSFRHFFTPITSVSKYGYPKNIWIIIFSILMLEEHILIVFNAKKFFLVSFLSCLKPNFLWNHSYMNIWKFIGIYNFMCGKFHFGWVQRFQNWIHFSG